MVEALTGQQPHLGEDAQAVQHLAREQRERALESGVGRTRVRRRRPSSLSRLGVIMRSARSAAVSALLLAQAMATREYGIFMGLQYYGPPLDDSIYARVAAAGEGEGSRAES